MSTEIYTELQEAMVNAAIHNARVEFLKFCITQGETGLPTEGKAVSNRPSVRPRTIESWTDDDDWSDQVSEFLNRFKVSKAEDKLMEARAVSVRQAARVADVTEKTVREWVKNPDWGIKELPVSDKRGMHIDSLTFVKALFRYRNRNTAM